MKTLNKSIVNKSIVKKASNDLTKANAAVLADGLTREEHEYYRQQRSKRREEARLKQKW